MQLLKLHKASFLIRENAVASLGEEAAQVFDAHDGSADPEMIGQIKETIRTKINAEAGLKEVTDMFIAIFEGMEDNFTCKNVADIRDVTKRVLPTCLKKLPNPVSINEEAIGCA